MSVPRPDYRGLDLAAARRSLAACLREAGTSDPELDARLLVAHASGIEPSRVSIEGDLMLSEAQSDALARHTRERLAGRTVARILGRRAFHDIVLAVTDDVLEPRDDTGTLVEAALPFLRAVCDAHGSATLWDVGTGSGAIALALLVAEPRANALCTDIDPAALDLACANATALDLADRVRIERRDALEGGGEERFGLIVSNPPYIPSAEIDGLAPEVRADPRAALDGGPDGLAVYRRLAADGLVRLAEGGVLLVEFGAGQGADVGSIFVAEGWRARGTWRDLGGVERVAAFMPFV